MLRVSSATSFVVVHTADTLEGVNGSQVVQEHRSVRDPRNANAEYVCVGVCLFVFVWVCVSVCLQGYGAQEVPLGVN